MPATAGAKEVLSVRQIGVLDISHKSERKLEGFGIKVIHFFSRNANVQWLVQDSQSMNDFLLAPPAEIWPIVKFTPHAKIMNEVLTDREKYLFDSLSFPCFKCHYSFIFVGFGCAWSYPSLTSCFHISQFGDNNTLNIRCFNVDCEADVCSFIF